MKAAVSASVAGLLLQAGAALAHRGFCASMPSLVRRMGDECGEGIGSCPSGQCCSGSGYCGTTEDYCEGSDCQLDYSTNCDTFFGPPGESTVNVARPELGKVPYGTIINDCTEKGVIALAFDDGPWDFTEQLLDLLDKEDIKATFFIAANNRGKGEIDEHWTSVMHRIYDTGHQMASHTWTHRDLSDINGTLQHSEMIYAEMAFRNIFGFFPTYMRPPYLDCTAASGCLTLLKSLGYHVINANLDTKDYENDAPELIGNSEAIFSNGVSSDAASNQYLILAHDVHNQTVQTLVPYMIKTARERGYKFATVGECLGDPVENWYRQAPGSIITPTGTSGAGEGGACATDAVAANSTNIENRAADPQATCESSPKPTGELKPSPNQQCGGDTGYTCQGSSFGKCCSFYGYCGSSEAYCGTGCDSNFGECNPQSANVTDTSNGLCGPQFKSTCAKYGSKNCCSQYGFCGNSDAHCGSGCQGNYGTCN